MKQSDRMVNMPIYKLCSALNCLLLYICILNIRWNVWVIKK